MYVQLTIYITIKLSSSSSQLVLLSSQSAQISIPKLKTHVPHNPSKIIVFSSIFSCGVTIFHDHQHHEQLHAISLSSLSPVLLKSVYTSAIHFVLFLILQSNLSPILLQPFDLFSICRPVLTIRFPWILCFLCLNCSCISRLIIIIHVRDQLHHSKILLPQCVLSMQGFIML